jgi:CRP-like cAMP-binding protein
VQKDKFPIDVQFDGPAQCANCGIRDLVLFSSLKDEDFALIHQPIDEPRFEKGEILYRENEPADHFYTVREGLVKLVHKSAGGEEQIVRLLKRGDVLGLEALVGKKYKATAVAIDSTLTCEIPLSVIIKLDKNLPHFRRHLLERWQRSVDEAEDWLQCLRTGPIKIRLARFLLRLAEGEPSGTIFLPTREDMGNMLAVKIESISRAVAEFKRQGMIKKVAAYRFSLDVDMLQKIVH